MKSVYVINENSVELNLSKMLQFEHDGLSYLDKIGLYDVEPTVVFVSESEDEALKYLRDTQINISNVMGNAVKYRIIEWYTISKYNYTEEEMADYNNLEELVKDGYPESIEADYDRTTYL